MYTEDCHERRRGFFLLFRTEAVLSNLGLDHLLGNGAHGIGEPALKAFGKVTDGLSQGTWRGRR